MAYSQEALTSLLRRKRQYEALGGRLSTHETEGIVRGVLSTEAGKDIEASRLAKDEAIRKRYLDIQEQGMKDQALSGYLQTGMTALGTETGKKAIGKAGEFLGIGSKTAPALTVPATTAPSLGVYGGSALAGMGGGAAAPAITGTGAAVTASGALTAPTSMAPTLGVYESSALAGMGGTAPAVAAPGAIPSAMSAGPLIAGTIAASAAGRWLGSQKSFQEITPWGGQKTEKMMGGAMMGGIGGSLIAGAMEGGISGPVGAVIGGVVGLVTGGTVICSELHRQGYITSEELELDSLYRIKYIDDETYAGYVSWATKVVELMQKSKIVTQMVRPFGVGWAKEMSHRLEPERKGSLIGKLLLKFGVPICRYIGKRRELWAAISEEL